MKRLRPLFAIALVAVIIVGVIYWLRTSQREVPTPFVTQGRLQIYALDVGQGDSELIISPEGKSVLIDAGPPQAGDEVVAARQLKLAKTLVEDGLIEKAKERYRDIVKRYPNTKAAAEAKELLEKP